MLSRRISGFTIAELLVYCLVFGFCLTGVFGIFKAGKDSFEMGAINVDLQGNALRAARQLARELRESNWVSTKNFLTSPKGVIFVSPRDPSDNNSFDYNVTDKKIYWHKLVCYYVATNSQTGLKALIRKEATINATSQNLSVTTLDAAHDTPLEFSNDAALRSKVIADYVDESQFSITVDPVITNTYNILLPLSKEQKGVTYELILAGRSGGSSSDKALIRVTVRNQLQ